ncbi:hypothetical protein QU39_00055, partial [Staphylococcus aureus]
ARADRARAIARSRGRAACTGAASRSDFPALPAGWARPGGDRSGVGDKFELGGEGSADGVSRPRATQGQIRCGMNASTPSLRRGGHERAGFGLSCRGRP